MHTGRELAAGVGAAYELEKAHTAAQELFKVNPSFSAKGIANARDNKDRVMPKRFLATLRKSGLPEE